MAQIKTLLSFQWKMYLRCLEVNSMRKTERMLASWIAMVVFIRYAVNTAFIVSSFSNDNRAFGPAMLEFHLLYAGIILVIGPFLLRTVLATGFSLNAQRMRLVPVSPVSMFIVKITETVFRPSFVIVFLCSVFSVSLLALTPHPVIGSILGILFVFFCTGLSLLITAVSADLTENRTAKSVCTAVLVLFALALVGANCSFLVHGDELLARIGGSLVLLWNRETGTGLLPDIRPFVPLSWVTSGSSAEVWIPSLAFFSLCILFFAFAIFFICCLNAKKSPAPDRRTSGKRDGRIVSFFFRNRKSAILQNHLVRICSEPVYLFCSFLILASGVMLFPGNNDLDGVLAFVVLTAFVIEGRLFFNLFGYDAYCLDRFRLAPVSGAAILKEKNAALFIAMTIQYLPFFILSLIASGIASAIFLFLVSCVCWVAYTIWGNVSSLLLITPSVMKDGANSSQNDRFMNVCASILPLFAVYYVKEMLSSVSVLITTLIGIVSLGLCIVVYITLIPRQGRYFERKIEEVVTELSVQ